MGGAVSSGRDNNELIDNLMGGNYIRTREVERVFRVLDRADYMTPDGRAQAYKDLAWRNGPLHMSAPCIYSEVLEGLEMKPGLSFLNIGSGTGYFSTLVGLLIGSGGINHGVEVHPYVLEYAVKKLSQFIENSATLDEFDFCEPKFYSGNGLCLAPLQAPYDRVYCGAACPEQYHNYFKQLIKVGGILVMPLNDNLVQVRRTAVDAWSSRNLLNVSFATLKEPTKEEAADLIKLDEQTPGRLQALCRAVVRSSMRAALVSKHPQLREPPARRPPLAPACPRRICIPIEDDSDMEGLNALHDLDATNGANEMNALLSLVLSMGQNRVAGALRFDSLESPSDSSDEGEGERDDDDRPDGPDPPAGPPAPGPRPPRHPRIPELRFIQYLGPNVNTGPEIPLDVSGPPIPPRPDLPGPPIPPRPNLSGPPIPPRPDLPRPDNVQQPAPEIFDPQNPNPEIPDPQNPNPEILDPQNPHPQSFNPQNFDPQRPPRERFDSNRIARNCRGLLTFEFRDEHEPSSSSDRRKDENTDNDRKGCSGVPAEVEIYLGKETAGSSQNEMIWESTDTVPDETKEESSSDEEVVETKEKRKKLDSGIGEGTTTSSGSSPVKSESNAEESDVETTGTTGTGSHRRQSSSSVDVNGSDVAAEVPGNKSNKNKRSHRVRRSSSGSGSASDTSGGARRKRRVCARRRAGHRHGSAPRRAGPDARRVRLSIMMKRAVKELPLPYALKKYINYGRCFQF